MEETTYKWTEEKTKQLMNLQIKNDSLFTKKRNAARQAWDFVFKELGLEGAVSHKQPSKKWENLKKKYKELKKPPTGSGTDQGEDTPSTWPYYMRMHEALGSRPSICPPVLVASCLPDPTILPPTPAECSPGPSCSTSPPGPSNSSSLISSSSPSITPSPSPDSPQPSASKRRKRAPEGLMEFLQKEDKRQEENRKQMERLLAAFEKMADIL